MEEQKKTPTITNVPDVAMVLNGPVNPIPEEQIKALIEKYEANNKDAQAKLKKSINHVEMVLLMLGIDVTKNHISDLKQLLTNK